MQVYMNVKSFSLNVNSIYVNKSIIQNYNTSANPFILNFEQHTIKIHSSAVDFNYWYLSKRFKEIFED